MMINGITGAHFIWWPLMWQPLRSSRYYCCLDPDSNFLGPSHRRPWRTISILSNRRTTTCHSTCSDAQVVQLSWLSFQPSYLPAFFEVLPCRRWMTRLHSKFCLWSVYFPPFLFRVGWLLMIDPGGLLPHARGLARVPSHLAFVQMPTSTRGCLEFLRPTFRFRYNQRLFSFLNM